MIVIILNKVFRGDAVVKLFQSSFRRDLVKPPYVFIDSKLFSLTLFFFFTFGQYYMYMYTNMDFG